RGGGRAAPRGGSRPGPARAQRPPALDARRVSWYGDQVFHRQLDDRLTEQAQNPERVANGYGYFFRATCVECPRCRIAFIPTCGASPMRVLIAAVLTAALACGSRAEDKGVPVEWGGFKSTTPAGWKEETPSNKMRLAQFKLAKEKGDPEDAELALFASPG